MARHVFILLLCLIILETDRLVQLRDSSDVTFNGIAPEPSSVNMQAVIKTLGERKEKFKLGAIIDPDGDRIRFTDGTTEISMNQFGAMAYHFLHEVKGRKGHGCQDGRHFKSCQSDWPMFLVKRHFEPRVGFKEFKPVIGKGDSLF